MDRIKVAKSIAAGGFMAGLLTSPSGSADDVEIKFGGYIKLDAAYTTNGVDGVQDSTGNYKICSAPTKMPRCELTLTNSNP